MSGSFRLSRNSKSGILSNIKGKSIMKENSIVIGDLGVQTNG